MKSLYDLRSALILAVTHQRDRLAEGLIAGRVSVDDYKSVVGRLHGHRDALDAIAEVFRKLDDEEGDDT